MRVAVIHDWLLTMRGGEKVLEAILELFPHADLFTLIYKKGALSSVIENRQIFTSPLQTIPGAFERYKHFLPFFPRWIEKFDLKDYDLIISSSSCVAKGIQKRKDARHIAYVHAPMRYMWDRFDDYFGKGKASLATRLGALAFRGYLRSWDRRISQDDRIDHLIANSRFIAEKIQEFYQREAKVIYPFVDLERFAMAENTEKRNSYLCFGALVPYKRIDLAVEAFNQLGLPLTIAGGGPELDKLKSHAKENIQFLGRVEDKCVQGLYQNAKALVFPGQEDFGITPLESMACGTPVIAYGSGGAVETVSSECGVLFKEQSVQSLKNAVEAFEKEQSGFEASKCRAQAEKFSQERFKTEFKQILNSNRIKT